MYTASADQPYSRDSFFRRWERLSFWGGGAEPDEEAEPELDEFHRRPLLLNARANDRVSGARVGAAWIDRVGCLAASLVN
jgi:hypothetical protein